jgi:ribose transport system permease protein
MVALLGVILSIFLTERGFSGRWACLPWSRAARPWAGCTGFLVTRIRLQPFIVTLCGLLLYRGLARFVANDETKGFGAIGSTFGGLKPLATGTLLGIPMPLIVLLVIALITGVLLHRSVWGRHLYAVGKNEDAARYAGVNTQRVVTSAYVLSGLLAGIAGVLLAFYTNSISPSSHGVSYELYAIAAAVLGGCSLRGGEGSIVGILIGTALIVVLRNLVNLVEIGGRPISSALELAVIGAVILLGVMADELLKRRGAARRARPAATTPTG